MKGRAFSQNPRKQAESHYQQNFKAGGEKLSLRPCRGSNTRPSDRESEKEGNMGLYVHRNHEGLLGTGKFGGSGILYLTPTRYTVTTRMILH